MPPLAYQDKLSLLEDANKKLKGLRKELDDKVEKIRRADRERNQAPSL